MAYATRAQLASIGVKGAAIATIPTADQDAALDAASALADGYLRSRYDVPRTTVGMDLTSAVCKIAAYDLLVVRGFNPQAGADVNIRMRYDDAIKWLEAVAKGLVHLVDAAPLESSDFDQPRVVTSTRRGW